MLLLSYCITICYITLTVDAGVTGRILSCTRWRLILPRGGHWTVCHMRISLLIVLRSYLSVVIMAQCRWVDYFHLPRWQVHLASARTPCGEYMRDKPTEIFWEAISVRCACYTVAYTEFQNATPCHTHDIAELLFKGHAAAIHIVCCLSAVLQFWGLVQRTLLTACDYYYFIMMQALVVSYPEGADPNTKTTYCMYCNLF